MLEISKVKKTSDFMLITFTLQEMIDIVETIYRGARKGRGLVVSPKDYSTKYRY